MQALKRGKASWLRLHVCMHAYCEFQEGREASEQQTLCASVPLTIYGIGNCDGHRISHLTYNKRHGLIKDRDHTN